MALLFRVLVRIAGNRWCDISLQCHPPNRAWQIQPNRSILRFVAVVHTCPPLTGQRPTLTIEQSAHFSLQ